MDGFWITLSLALIYGCLYLGSNWILMYLKNKNKIKKDPEPTIYPSISVIIPAYNAEETIAECIESVLQLEYPGEIETIVVDDGSKDNTAKIAKEYPIKYMRVKHGGKSRAMNNAIKKAKGEVIATLDSDSFVTPNALMNMIGYLEEPKTMAVIPTIKTHKPQRMLEKLQHIEYLYSAFLRKLFTFFESLHVVPGPFSLFKKEVFEELGGFDENNPTEDMEMGLRILDAGYDIKCSLNAEVLTVVPDNLDDLMKQRVRWYTGNLRNISAYKHILFELDNLGMVLITSLLSVVILLLALILLGRGLLIQAEKYFNLGRGYWSIGPSLDYFLDGLLSFEYSFNILSFYLPGIVFTLMFVTLLALCLFICFKITNEGVQLGMEHILYATIYNIMLGVIWANSLFKEMVRKVKGRA